MAGKHVKSFQLEVVWDEDNATWSVGILNDAGRLVASATNYDNLSLALDYVSEAIALAI